MITKKLIVYSLLFLMLQACTSPNSIQSLDNLLDYEFKVYNYDFKYSDPVNQSFDLPDRFVAESSTVELVYAIVTNPYAIHLTGYHSYRQGFLAMKGMIIATQELLSRDDLGEEIAKLFLYYASKEDYNLITMNNLAALINQPEVYYKIPDDKVKEINLVMDKSFADYVFVYDHAAAEMQRPFDEVFLKECKTKELVTAVLHSASMQDFKYPYSLNLRERFQSMLHYHNGLQELVLREDAASEMVNAFLSFDLNSYRIDFDVLYAICALINQPEFFLLEYSDEVYDKVLQLQSEYPWIAEVFERAAQETDSPLV